MIILNWTEELPQLRHELSDKELDVVTGGTMATANHAPPQPVGLKVTIEDILITS